MADLTDTRRTGPVAAAGLAAVLVAVLSLQPAMQGAGWWLQCVLFAGVAVGVQCAGRALHLPQAAGALLALATIPMLAVSITPGGSLLVPTPGAAQAVDDAVALGVRQIVEDAVPVQPTPGLVLMVAGGAALAAILVDLVAVGLRAPITAMLVVLALALVPGKALPIGTNGWLLAAVAITALLVVAADRRRRGGAPHLAGVIAGGAGALVVSLAVQSALPAPALAVPLAPAQALFGPGVDPLVRLGQDLRRGVDTPVISYRSTAGRETTAQPEYLRLAVLEDFTGRVWSPNRADEFSGDANLPPAPPPAGAIDGTLRTTQITPLDQFAVQQRLPLTYPATAVQGVSGFGWDSEGLTLSRDSGPAVGAYTVRSTDIDTSSSRLAGATTSAPAGDPDSTDVPAVTALVRRTALAWTTGKNVKNTPYAKALAIQDQLAGGSFVYDENTPVQPSFDGDNLAVIDQFLKVKRGYCVHFASTMAVMARIVGIPSRIVVGYQPGDEVGTGRDSHYVVTSDDLHAWPELYFDRLGWVRFEPTPGRGIVPSYAPVLSSPSASAQQEVANPHDSAVARPSASATTAPVASPPGGGPSGPDLTGIARGAGIVGLVALLIALPGLTRLAVRRRRIGHLRHPGGIAAAWREVLDTADDLGLPVPSDASPRAQAAALAAAAGTAVAALARVRASVERDAYGATPPPVSPDDLRDVLTALAAGRGRRTRVRAALLPPSLAAMLGRVATGVRMATIGERPVGSRRSPGRTGRVRRA